MKLNDFLKLVRERKTTYEFSDKKISSKSLQQILEAGRWAPSASNLQPWKFRVIQNEKQIDALMKTAFYGAFHTNPVVLVAISIPADSWRSGAERQIESDKLGEKDAWLHGGFPALQMVLAAQSDQIASCILSPNPEKAAKILGLKKGELLPLLVGLGFEKKSAFEKEKTRKSLDELVTFNPK